ncbi:MAG: alpha-E domain-containing protein [Planctomycetaceae bacterium]|nr:alpha-E domain-containing protein [Planctomycetaceae bacterium]
MLSRVANSIYWMSRYVERAENLARFMEVTLNVMLDLPDRSVQQWEPLVRATGDEEYFGNRYPDFSADHVRQFLTFDREYHSSILTSITLARENARTVREVISSEAWEQLNAFYHFIRNASHTVGTSPPATFYDEIVTHSYLFNGIVDATMTHDAGWHFANVGRLLERADKTSRILDVKYFTLHRRLEDVDTTFDDLLWSAVLRSASGFEMFRKRYHTLTVHRIVEFLILNRSFPRSVRYCIDQVRASLSAIPGPVDQGGNPALRIAEAMADRLEQTDVHSIINGGVHEFVDALQTSLNDVGGAIRDTYFALRKFPERQPA